MFHSINILPLRLIILLVCLWPPLPLSPAATHLSPISLSLSLFVSPLFLILPLGLFISPRLLPASSLWEYYAFMLALFITLNSLINYSINFTLLSFCLSLSPSLCVSGCLHVCLSVCLSLRGLGVVLSLGLLCLRPGSFRDPD